MNFIFVHFVIVILGYFFCFRKHYNFNVPFQILLNYNLMRRVFGEFQYPPLLFNVHLNLLNYDSMFVFKNLYFTGSFEWEIIHYFLMFTCLKFLNFKKKF